MSNYCLFGIKKNCYTALTEEEYTVVELTNKEGKKHH